MAAEKIVVPKVYGAIVEVMSGLVELGGIAKGQRNKDQNYDFRGIDDVYNVLSKLLVAHKLVILPRVKNRKCYKRVTKHGSIQYNVVLEVDLEFVSSEDGSQHTVTTFGEASDMADKATNKAMSAAYKYAIIEAFCIPIDVPDADETTPEDTVQPDMQRPGTGSKSAAAKPAASKSAAAKPAASEGLLPAEKVAEIMASIDGCDNEAEICKIAKRFIATAAPKEGSAKVTKATASELAKAIAAKRATIASADSFQDFADMIASFCDRGWLGKKEAEIYLSNAKEN